MVAVPLVCLRTLRSAALRFAAVAFGVLDVLNACGENRFPNGFKQFANSGLKELSQRNWTRPIARDRRKPG